MTDRPGELRENLRELIAALDRRRGQPARRGEAQIAADAAALRRCAEQRIADLDGCSTRH
jgi:hypothetical protein